MSAKRQIQPPSLAQHWAELRARRVAWLILARNAIPLVGVYGLGWSWELAVFSYWIDGLLAVGAIMAVLMPRMTRETPALAAMGPANQFAAALFAWAILMVFVGLPYWIVLIPFAGMGVLWPAVEALKSIPSLWAGYGGVAASHYLAARKRNFDTLPEQELRQALRWDVYLLVLRALAMFTLMVHGLTLFLLPLMTLVMSYLEIWPQHALGAVFGDPTRLFEDAPDHDAAPPAARRK